MIINFSVQNFGSIKDKQILSFEASKSTHLEDYYIMQPIPGLRLLKLCLIYGANASGKTTVLKALDFLRDLVLTPSTKRTEEIKFNPFLFDADTPQQNTILSIDFVQNSTRYFYEVELNKKAIVREELNFYKPNKANVFRRTTDLEKQLTEISFGSKIKKDKVVDKVLESNTLWNNTVLGGFLKTNIELQELKDATDWFEDNLNKLILSETELRKYISDIIGKNESDGNLLSDILSKADFNISSILIKKDEWGDSPIDLKVLKKINVKEKNEKLQYAIDILKKGEKINFLSIKLKHSVAGLDYVLPLEEESRGTNQYFNFAFLLSLLINKPCMFMIDELESSLHPDLFEHFILSFITNAKNSQIIATTHNREFLEDKDIFRNDVIWFTEKNKMSATELYSLEDFDTKVIRKTSSIYNAYKVGKFGATPRVGDYYLDTEHE